MARNRRMETMTWPEEIRSRINALGRQPTYRPDICNDATQCPLNDPHPTRSKPGTPDTAFSMHIPRLTTR